MAWRFWRPTLWMGLTLKPFGIDGKPTHPKVIRWSWEPTLRTQLTLRPVDLNENPYVPKKWFKRQVVAWWWRLVFWLTPLFMPPCLFFVLVWLHLVIFLTKLPVYLWKFVIFNKINSSRSETYFDFFVLPFTVYTLADHECFCLVIFSIRSTLLRVRIITFLFDFFPSQFILLQGKSITFLFDFFHLQFILLRAKSITFLFDFLFDELFGV